MVLRAEFMNWTPLESSVLTAVAYSHDDRSLYLEFRSGAIYSKGRYFNAQIRDRYRWQEVRLITGRAIP